MGFNLILVICGYVLPVPSLVFAWREWLNLRKVGAAKTWRRTMSQGAILLVSVGFALWMYGVVHQVWLKDYSYIVPSARAGRLFSVGLIVVSSFVEAKLRRYLLLGSVGILFFFSASIGDLAI